MVVLGEINQHIFIEKVLPLDVSVLGNHKSYLREKQGSGVAYVLGFKEKIEVTWKHDYVSIGESDRQILNHRVMSLPLGGQVKNEFQVIVVLPFP